MFTAPFFHRFSLTAEASSVARIRFNEAYEKVEISFSSARVYVCENIHVPTIPTYLSIVVLYTRSGIRLKR